MAVQGGLGFEAISAGSQHTCGLTSAGAAYCWGYNLAGQLGDGTSAEPSASPAAVAGGLSFTATVTAAFYSCALATDGAAYCWGQEYGARPARVPGGLTFQVVSAGVGHACGLTPSGVAYCWGDNTAGQLGDGSLGGDPRPAPVAVTGGLTFMALSAGSFHTCGLTMGGAAYCWGANGAGELGDGTSGPMNYRAGPVAVQGGLTFQVISASASGVGTQGHSCALTAGGTAYCWGQNAFGQLGDGTLVNRTSPVAVGGGLTFASISAGGSYTCGLTSAGAAHCWGNNFMGQLGDGTTASRPSPTQVAGSHSFRVIGAGNMHTCAVTTGGAGYCWGMGDKGQLGNGAAVFPSLSTPAPVAGNLTFQAISAGGMSHTCGATTTGAAYCWGDNAAGQLGNGLAWRASPVAVVGGPPFHAISAGDSHTCALTSDGAAYCWGANQYGQLGDGTTVNRPTPVPVSGGLTFQSVATGGAHTCGLTTQGAAYCWGYSYYGQTGDGTTGGASRSRPAPVSGALSFQALSTGSDHTCGITTSGVAYCWGAYTGAFFGSTPGLASCPGGVPHLTYPCSGVPVQVGGDSLFQTVASGTQSTWALTANGTAFYWWSLSGPPASVEGFSFRLISAAGSHTCGITTDGAAYCWGSNSQGQLGNGTTDDSTEPVRVVGFP